jgi:hypothetical protein
MKGFDVNAPIRRPTRVFFRSRLMRLFRSVALLFPCFIGIHEESETIRLEMASNLFENKTVPIHWAAVGLSNPRLQVMESSLEFHAHMTGVT